MTEKAVLIKHPFTLAWKITKKLTNALSSPDICEGKDEKRGDDCHYFSAETLRVPPTRRNGNTQLCMLKQK